MWVASKSFSVESSKMCEAVIREYNSFSVDYSKTFSFKLVRIMTAVIRINCRTMNISILIPSGTNHYHSGDTIVFTFHQSFNFTRSIKWCIKFITIDSCCIQLTRFLFKIYYLEFKWFATSFRSQKWVAEQDLLRTPVLEL